MRSKLRTICAALVAVFAIGVVAAASASAAPEWYVKKAGKYEKVTTPVKVTGTASWELLVKPLFGPGGVAETFSGLAAELKPGGISIVNGFSVGHITALKSCKTILGPEEIRDLPWKVELYKEGTEIRSRIVEEKNGLPQYTFTCKWEFVGEQPENCNMNTSTKMTESPAGVESKFDAKSVKPKCVYEGPGEWKGTFATFKPIAGSGVEAIKVE